MSVSLSFQTDFNVKDLHRALGKSWLLDYWAVNRNLLVSLVNGQKEIQFHEISASQSKALSFLCQATRTDKIGIKLFVQVSTMPKKLPSNHQELHCYQILKVSKSWTYF